MSGLAATPLATPALLAAAVVLLLLLGLGVRVLGGRRGVRIDPEAAVAAAEQALPGFVALDAVVGADGAAALVVGEGDRLAVLRPGRRRALVREVGWPLVRSSGAGIVVETGDRRLGDVTLAGVDVLDVRRLAR